MNFWQRLRLIASLMVFAIAVLALVLSVLRTPEPDSPSDRPTRSATPASGTTGL